jgi:hypothetical protein
MEWLRDFINKEFNEYYAGLQEKDMRFKFAHEVKEWDFKASDAILEVGTLCSHVIHNWEHCGLTPVFLWLLCEDECYTQDEVDITLRHYIGSDYADIKITAWIERLEGLGFDFPDGLPVWNVVKELFEDKSSDC